MDSTKNGIVIRIPEVNPKESSLGRIVCDRIKSYLSLGYKLFVIEVSDKDLLLSTDLSEPEKERFFYYLDDLDIPSENQISVP